MVTLIATALAVRLTPVDASISLREVRMPVHRLLAEVERQTGVGFRVSKEIEPLRISLCIREMTVAKFRESMKRLLHLSWEERQAAEAPGGRAWFLYRRPRDKAEEDRLRMLPILRFRARLNEFIQAGKLTEEQLTRLVEQDSALDAMKSNPGVLAAARFLGSLPTQSLDRLASGKALGFGIGQGSTVPGANTLAHETFKSSTVVGVKNPPNRLALSGSPTNQGISIGISNSEFGMTMTNSLMNNEGLSDEGLSPFGNPSAKRSVGIVNWNPSKLDEKGEQDSTLLAAAENAGIQIIKEWFPRDISQEMSFPSGKVPLSTGPLAELVHYPWEAFHEAGLTLVQAVRWYDLRKRLILPQDEEELEEQFKTEPHTDAAKRKLASLTYEQAVHAVIRGRLRIDPGMAHFVLRVCAALTSQDRSQMESDRGVPMRSLSPKARAAMKEYAQWLDDEGKLSDLGPGSAELWIKVDPEKNGLGRIFVRNREGERFIFGFSLEIKSTASG